MGFAGVAEEVAANLPSVHVLRDIPLRQYSPPSPNTNQFRDSMSGMRALSFGLRTRHSLMVSMTFRGTATFK